MSAYVLKEGFFVERKRDLQSILNEDSQSGDTSDIPTEELSDTLRRIREKNKKMLEQEVPGSLLDRVDTEDPEHKPAAGGDQLPLNTVSADKIVMILKQGEPGSMTCHPNCGFYVKDGCALDNFAVNQWGEKYKFTPEENTKLFGSMACPNDGPYKVTIKKWKWGD